MWEASRAFQHCDLAASCLPPLRNTYKRRDSCIVSSVCVFKVCSIHYNRFTIDSLFANLDFPEIRGVFRTEIKTSNPWNCFKSAKKLEVMSIPTRIISSFKSTQTRSGSLTCQHDEIHI